tara:strand:+ start:18805 stop:19500 length:696 start_codon:yes stop_codon:yes gene_type:complete
MKVYVPIVITTPNAKNNVAVIYMRILELFSGTHSVGKVAKEKGYEVVSLDIDDYKGKYVPTHKEDIMTWNYKQYDPDYFDILWASPPCLYYSALQYSWYGRKKKDGIFTKEKHMKLIAIADGWVNKVLEIIKYFNLKKWFIENPRSGLMKDRPFMKSVPYIDVDYCMYSDFGYKKSTRIWSNVTYTGLLCNRKCGNMKDSRKHRIDVSRHKHKMDRYRIPPKLISILLFEM